jgi:hypothetical protein
MHTRTRTTLLPGLSEIGQRATSLRQPIVIVPASPQRAAETKRDKQRIQQLEAALAQANALNIATIERAHREARLDKLTIRVVDRRADWLAKQPKARSPHIILSPERMITCETWEQPQLD